MAVYITRIEKECLSIGGYGCGYEVGPPFITMVVQVQLSLVVCCSPKCFNRLNAEVKFPECDNTFLFKGMSGYVVLCKI